MGSEAMPEGIDLESVDLESYEPFMRLVMHYHCALLAIETKLHVLDTEFALYHNRNPIETIKSRVKTPASIVDKLKRKGLPITLDNIENNLSDIAGVRVICSCPEDIYTVADLLIGQDDITLIRRKDYFVHPKESGYRSLHLIVGVPVFLAEGKKMVKVEVQLRTIAMDFWASLEHKVKYKQDVVDAATIARELRECADIIASVDMKMQGIRDKIDAVTPQERPGPNIMLIKPTTEYAADIMRYRQEFLETGDRLDGCGSLKICETAQEWLDYLKNMERAETCPNGLVPAETWLAVRRSDNRMVGIIDFRHTIEHPVLRETGGHIGYSVRPSERRRGYASEMLRQNLENCRRFGLRRVLVTCHINNVASEKVIMANGGEFERLSEDGSVKRYWIEL